MAAQLIIDVNINKMFAHEVPVRPTGAKVLCKIRVIYQYHTGGGKAHKDFGQVHCCLIHRHRSARYRLPLQHSAHQQRYGLQERDRRPLRRTLGAGTVGGVSAGHRQTGYGASPLYQRQGKSSVAPAKAQIPFRALDTCGQRELEEFSQMSSQPMAAIQHSAPCFGYALPFHCGPKRHRLFSRQR